MTAKLTPKQEAFAVAVAKGANASDAYRTAYDAEKMKPAVVHVKASELLANGKVTVRIDQLRAPALKAAGASVDRTIQEVAGVAYADPKADGETIKYSDKLSALEMLMKHHGLYKADNKQKAPNVNIHVNLE